MRPDLNTRITPEGFRSYYWLKAELIAFCREKGIPVTGKKSDLADRIHIFLSTGKVTNDIKRKSSRTHESDNIPLSLNSRIPDNYISDERNRQFFKSHIGKHFKFNVPFMNWMKENPGRSYREAIDQWNKIYLLKKKGLKWEISPQFEYNQYTRDFFKANPSASKDDAIKCWKYKKSLPGPNKYERKDLIALRD
ncbi:MAG TPA: hypothetical protein DEA96_17225 [Leptospiraceae bacterium]|nr:hypothetical protein [Spirochaetaceae bacterium]HBS06714.1 hypothetical protein [Leptospiraceae bacterium]|tara:strand:- start:46831 stop:47412 length:582 start_codon:yes stop_codon:yes gene_type:complete